MKKCISMALAALLTLAFVCAGALADVTATASVNLRDDPSLSGNIIASVSEGTVLEYLGSTSTDERGVDWYNVEYDGVSCWVSSTYAVLETDPVEYDPEAAADYVELSAYCGADLAESAEALGLEDYESAVSESPDQYSNESVVIGGTSGYDVSLIYLTGAGYTLHGAAVGMDAETAKEAILENGLSLTRETDEVLIFSQTSDGNDWFKAGDGYYLYAYVNVYLSDGAVTAIEWGTYAD